jgi:hypothetical protein
MELQNKYNIYRTYFTGIGTKKSPKGPFDEAVYFTDRHLYFKEEAVFKTDRVFYSYFKKVFPTLATT